MFQQTQGVNIYGRTAGRFATITTDGNKERLDVSAIVASGLVPAEYDYISLSYTGDNVTTVVYKTGGSGGTTVATLTLAYSGSNLTSVTKT